MDAREAKSLSDKAVSAEGEIGGLLEHVYGQIRAAAKKGEVSIIDPLSGLRTIVSTRQRMGVYAELRRRGYRVEEKGGGDPREPGYIEVSWESA